MPIKRFTYKGLYLVLLKGCDLMESELHIYNIWMLIDIDVRVFGKKFTYPMHINKGRTITYQGAYASLVQTLSLIIFLS